ncbi:pollen receptor-like kinase 3 [Olea europaea subsp. europaea]|uniref:Pollen receptor-like kinase 3 n=1 Tax=Olea europaea subsp. europaea TaxID=158383 RepID=A0A8S0R0F0_OLEEU|nr:pollen receptor-like kinase 3 [Olea europaea subsp. europaea]
MAIIHVLGSQIFFCIFLINFVSTSSNTDSEALLKLKASFTDTKALDSWMPGTEACDKTRHWVRVSCDNGSVTGLRLGNLGLSGKIDVDALVNITGIRSLSLMSNSFSGPIPEFHRMGALKGLYLSGNQFSGEIPSDYFSTMSGLKKVWLSGNNFTGEIPSSLVQLSHLIELHLENNQFSGTIPLFEQPSLISFDLSNNNLEGPIPPGLVKFNASSFKGNAGLCGENIGKACDPFEGSISPSPHNKIVGKENTRISIWLLIVVIVVLLAMAVGIFVMRRRQVPTDLMIKENLEDSVDLSAPNVGKKDLESSQKGVSSSKLGLSRKGSTHGRGVADLIIVNDERGEFGLADLMKAAAEVLATGTLGSSYKATMGSGLTVVVKRIKEMNKMGNDQFDAQMRRIGRLKHRNVLTPLAYHYRKDEKLLVNEFIAKGSLLYLLHGDRGISHAELNWPVRLMIVQGIARGLGYLHAELASLELPHGNLKSSNVLLTATYEPLLTDYGFCSLINSTQGSQVLVAYKSPEAVLQHPVSPKSDVYCLGIIIFEILTGKFPSQYHNNGKGGVDLVQWVKSAIAEGREGELYDPDIASSKNSLGEMEQLLHIGAACTENNPEQRLDIPEAIRRIEGIPIEGDQEDRTFQVMPSLRDGFGASQSTALETNTAGRRIDSAADRSGLNSFAFDTS